MGERIRVTLPPLVEKAEKPMGSEWQPERTESLRPEVHVIQAKADDEPAGRAPHDQP